MTEPVGGMTCIFAYIEVGHWRVASELRIGPRLGIKEFLWLYDTREPLEAHALIHRGEMDFEHQDYQSLHDVATLRAKRKRHARERDQAIALCVDSMEKLIRLANTEDGKLRLAPHLELIAKDQCRSIGAFSGGLPGSAR